MLLLYGLLIALVLVLWTALDLRRKGNRAERREAAARRADEVQQPPATPQAARAGSGNGSPLRQPAAQPASAVAPAASGSLSRRTADSESVVSYSVRPRVNAAEDRAAPAQQTPERAGAREPEPAQSGATDRPVPPPPGRSNRTARPPAQSRPISPSGADSGQPQGAVPRRPVAPTSAARQRSEDAFERFLRGSADDDDF